MVVSISHKMTWRRGHGACRANGTHRAPQIIRNPSPIPAELFVCDPIQSALQLDTVSASMFRAGTYSTTRRARPCDGTRDAPLTNVESTQPHLSPTGLCSETRLLAQAGGECLSMMTWGFDSPTVYFRHAAPRPRVTHHDTSGDSFLKKLPVGLTGTL